MAVLTIGRIGLEGVDLDATQAMEESNQSGEGQRLKLSGYLRSTSLANTNYLRQSFLTIEPGSLVAVTYTDDTTINGWYWFLSGGIMASAENVSLKGVGYFHFEVELVKAGKEGDVWFQSRLTGTVRSNDMGVSSTEALPFVGFPEPSMVWWGQTQAVGTQLARTSTDGIVRVFYDESIYSSTAREDPRWSVPSSEFYYGAVEVTVGGYLRTGQRIPAGNTTNWVLSNGLVKIAPNGSNAGQFDFSAFDGSSWDPAKAIKFNYSSGTAISGAWDELTILRNEPQAATIRLTKSISTGTKEPIFLDATLRRGSRFVEFRMNQAANREMRMGFTTAENISTGITVSGSTLGVLSRTVSTSNGNRYVFGSAKRLTISTAGGFIANTTDAKTWDSWVGAEVGGAAAVTGDLSTDLARQYLGAVAEDVRVVLR